MNFEKENNKTIPKSILLEDINDKQIIEDYLNNSGICRQWIENNLITTTIINNILYRRYNNINFALLINGRDHTKIPTLNYNNIKSYNLFQIENLIEKNEIQQRKIQSNQFWDSWVINLATAQTDFNKNLCLHVRNIKLFEKNNNDINTIIESNKKYNPFITIFT